MLARHGGQLLTEWDVIGEQDKCQGRLGRTARFPIFYAASGSIVRGLPVKSASRSLALVVCLLICGGTACAQSCPDTPDSDALRQIARCLAKQDCGSRTVVDSENLGKGCKDEIDVWSWHSNRRAAAIRDIKMCRLNGTKQPQDEGFLHGLLLPLEPFLCGVEDPLLYAKKESFDFLWKDAWDAALKRNLPEGQITLVINPREWRSMDHLHIHIMRSNLKTFSPDDGTHAHVLLDSLDNVWDEADKLARRKLGMVARDYGIAIRRSNDRFVMLVEGGRNLECWYGVC